MLYRRSGGGTAGRLNLDKALIVVAAQEVGIGRIRMRHTDSIGADAPGSRRDPLLKRWLMGTHEGAFSHEHLDYHLDEFTFRFNRCRSQSRGKLFFRLAQQAVAVDPVIHHRTVHPTSAKAKTKPQTVGVT